MGLIQQEIKELRKMLQDLDSGDLKHDALMDKIAIYSQSEKRARLLLDSLALGAKYGNSAARRIINTNLIGNEEAIDLTLGSSGNEKVMCETQDKIISRDECLDYSGNPPKGVDCSGCKNFKITRKLLLDE